MTLAGQRLPPGARLVLFARAPRRGQVKTRLAAGIGETAALAFYRTTLWRVTQALAEGPWRLELAVTPDESAAVAALWPAGPSRRPQGAGDLGQRMARLLAEATPEAPLLIVGSDIPALGAGEAAAAFVLLRTHDLVFGPALDGGFWAVGARRAPPAGLFAGVGWSRPTTLADSLATCGGRSVALAATLADVDDAEDYRRWRAGA